MKKAIALLLGGLLMTGAATGCTKGGTAGGAGNNIASPVSVTLWVLDSHVWVDEAVSDFKKENPHIDVQLSKYAVDPMKEALKVAANSKTLPDMWFTWGGSLGSFYAENGMTMDLTQASKDHKWSEIYDKAAIDLSTYSGKVAGIPYHLNAVDMWYSKNVYGKLNLKAPATFDEFEAQLKTMKESGVTPLGLGAKGGWHLMRLTDQLLEHFAGPELHDKLNGLSASWNNPAVVRTFERLREYTSKGYFPKGYVSLEEWEAYDLFLNDKTGLTVEGSWLDRNIRSDGFNPADYGVFKFPSDRTPARTSVFAEMFQINGKIDRAKQETALKLGEYLTSPLVANKYIDNYGTAAALNVTFAETTPHIRPLLAMAKAGSFLITDQALPQQITQTLFEAQDKVTLGEWTPQQAAEAMDKAVADYKSKRK